MTITFISNYLNHHQYPFCSEFVKNNDIQFTFIATSTVRKERLDLGYRDMNDIPFVLTAYSSEENRQKSLDLCRESDVVIIGSAPEEYAEVRITTGKILFRYFERIFKKGLIYSFSPRAVRNIWISHSRHKNKKVYMLCAGAYVAADFNRMGAYKGKTYKWGYFPEVKEYRSIERLISEKEDNSILWVGRLIDWKHPEIPIKVASMLRDAGYKFLLKIIGTGDMQGKVEAFVKSQKLEDCVQLLGAMSPENVRMHMEQSQILLFTSDFNEGWGAVLNEAMNSGCAVVASHAIGSVPFMVKDRQNGMIYKNGKVSGAFDCVECLLKDKFKRISVQKNAYKTLLEEWNPTVAASRFLCLCGDLLDKDECLKHKDGPCSKAEKLKNNWYKG